MAHPRQIEAMKMARATARARARVEPEQSHASSLSCSRLAGVKLIKLHPLSLRLRLPLPAPLETAGQERSPVRGLMMLPAKVCVAGGRTLARMLCHAVCNPHGGAGYGAHFGRSVHRFRRGPGGLSMDRRAGQGALRQHAAAELEERAERRPRAEPGRAGLRRRRTPRMRAQPEAPQGVRGRALVGGARLHRAADRTVHEPAAQETAGHAEPAHASHRAGQVRSRRRRPARLPDDLHDRVHGHGRDLGHRQSGQGREPGRQGVYRPEARATISGGPDHSPRDAAPAASPVVPRSARS